MKKPVALCKTVCNLFHILLLTAWGGGGREVPEDKNSELDEVDVFFLK